MQVGEREPCHMAGNMLGQHSWLCDSGEVTQALWAAGKIGGAPVFLFSTAS